MSTTLSNILPTCKHFTQIYPWNFPILASLPDFSLKAKLALIEVGHPIWLNICIILLHERLSHEGRAIRDLDCFCAVWVGWYLSVAPAYFEQTDGWVAVGWQNVRQNRSPAKWPKIFLDLTLTSFPLLRNVTLINFFEDTRCDGWKRRPPEIIKMKI